MATGSIWGHFNAFFMRQIEERIMDRLNELLNPKIEAIDVKVFEQNQENQLRLLLNLIMVFH